MPNMNSFVENRAAEDINFPVSYYTLHSDVSINFQMNRFYDWVGDPTMLTEMHSAACRITSYADLKREILFWRNLRGPRERQRKPLTISA